MKDELTRKAYRSTNLSFVISDIMEMSLMDMESDLKAVGMELRFKDRHDFKTAIAAVKRLRGAVNFTDYQNQLDFGDASDEIFALIKERVNNLI